MAKYIPKICHFELDRLEMVGMLAALDNNFNCGREHLCEITESGEKLRLKFKYSIAWRKPTMKFVARNIFKKNDWSYMKDMLSDAARPASVGQKVIQTSKRKVMSPIERDRCHRKWDEVRTHDLPNLHTKMFSNVNIKSVNILQNTQHNIVPRILCRQARSIGKILQPRSQGTLPQHRKDDLTTCRLSSVEAERG